MKKTLIVLICLTLLLMTGCTGGEQVKSNDDNVTYQEGIYKHKDWDNIDGYIDDICIPDKDAAVKIASSILDSFQKNGYYSNYVAQKVFYDTQDKIWIVSFWEDRSPNYVGGDFCIALKAENAQVIKMWCGE